MLETNKIYLTENYTFQYRYGAFEKTRPHGHVNWEFVLSPEGDSIHHINGTAHKIQPFSIIAIADTASHRIECKRANHRHTDVFVSDESLKELCHTLFSHRLYDYLHNTPFPCLVLSKSEYQVISNHLFETYNQETSSKRKRNLTRAILIHILSLFYRQVEHGVDDPPAWLSDLVDQLQDPSFFCLPINEIIKISNYSQSRFCYLFKKHYGYRLTDYINKLKLDYVENLLVFSNKSILEIASLAGYDSMSSFTHFFKRLTGVTPSEYRLKTKNQSNES